MKRSEQICVVGSILLFAFVTVGEISVFTGSILLAGLIVVDLIG
jgi:hypothetical protein